MIELFTGTPGSGKSYDACRLIRHYLKTGRDVIANFEVIVDENWSGDFTFMPNNCITVGNIVDKSRDYWSGRKFKEEGLLVVIDEAQLLFNSRNWQDADRMSWLELMSQNRKYGLKIVLICQADIMIDKQFRALVEIERNHRKVENIGLGGKLIRLLSFSQLFYCCSTYYGMKVKVDGEWIRYSPKVAAMYNSYKEFEMAGDVRSASPAAESGEVVSSGTLALERYRSSRTFA